MDTTLVSIASNNHHCAPQSLTLKSARTHCSCACWAAVCCELKGSMWKMWTRKNDKCGRNFVSCFWHWKAHCCQHTLGKSKFLRVDGKNGPLKHRKLRGKSTQWRKLVFFVVFTFGLLAFKAGAGFWHWRKKIGQVSRTGKKNGNRILEFWKRQRYSKFHAWNLIGVRKRQWNMHNIMPNWHVHSSKWHILSQRT